ncbi:MAG: YciI family protein [Solirubrobacteraceae bacterium]
MPHILLLYDYVGDILERRGPYRAEHLAALDREKQAGHVLIAGPYGDPPVGAAFVFKGVEAEHVRSFVLADPYVSAGLVRDWRVEPYTLVVAP